MWQKDSSEELKGGKGKNGSVITIFHLKYIKIKSKDR